MKKKKPVLIFAVIFVILAFLAYAVVVLNVETEKEAENGEKVQVQKNESLEDVIQNFAETIYSYDTSQRNFYEGAEQYMTQEGYDRFVPLRDETQEEEIEDVIQMSSHLQELNCYYKPVDSRAEVIVEAWFTLSGTGEFRIRQLIKLSVVQTDGWKIDDCIVLDTMEE